MSVPSPIEFETPSVGSRLLGYFQKVAQERLEDDLPGPPEVSVEVATGSVSDPGLTVRWGERTAQLRFLALRSLWSLDLEEGTVEGFDRVLKNLRRRWTVPRSTGRDCESGPKDVAAGDEHQRDEGIRV